jgi:hypothetical protein
MPKVTRFDREGNRKTPPPIPPPSLTTIIVNDLLGVLVICSILALRRMPNGCLEGELP